MRSAGRGNMHSLSKKQMERVKVTYEQALVRIVRSPNGVSPVLFALRKPAGVRAVVEMFRIAEQGLFHPGEPLNYSHWEADPNRYVECALHAYAQLAGAGLSAQELAECQTALYEQLFRVGARFMVAVQQARLHETERSASELEAEKEVVQRQLEFAESEFLRNCEALSKHSLAGQASRGLQSRLALRRRLGDLQGQRDKLTELRAQILKQKAACDELAAIPCAKDFVQFAELVYLGALEV